MSVSKRRLVWFSCGAASAAAAKLATEQYDNVEVLYCDTYAYEHPDNPRFLKDVEKWIGKKIKVLKSDKYKDIYDVFDKTGWLVGNAGARCTTELKKKVRQAYQQPDDIHVMGFTFEEVHRADRFKNNNPELYLDNILIDNKVSKGQCKLMLQQAGIEIPTMYKLGYKNNNCIGCVKGGMGYWNKIRDDFPNAFNKMAKQERKMNVSMLKRKGERLFLDELPLGVGVYKEEPDISCGMYCGGLDSQSGDNEQLDMFT